MITYLTYYDTSRMLEGRTLYYLYKKWYDGSKMYEYKPVSFGFIAKSGLYVVYHAEPILLPIGYGPCGYFVPFLNHKQGTVYRSSLPKSCLFTDVTEDERKDRVLL